MVKIVDNQRAIVDRPLRFTEGKILGFPMGEGPSRKGAGVFVSAEYTISSDIITTLGGPLQIGMVLSGVHNEAKASIANSVIRSYATSGLRVRTGALIRAAEREFNVTLQLRSNRIVVSAVWYTALVYFRRRVYGYVGPDKLGRRFGRGFDRPRPRGYFIKFDGQARREVRMMIESRIRNALQNRRQRIQKSKKAEEINKKVQQSRSLRPGLKLTKHRLKRMFREAGASTSEAKIFAEGLYGQGIESAIRAISKLLQNRQLTRETVSLRGKAFTP